MTARELDLTDDTTARTAHEVVRAAYRVEADLIGSDAIPALRETLAELRALPLRWLGVGAPDAIIAWTVEDEVVDIDRLCVHPDHFRRGLATTLLTALLARTSGPVTVSTVAANTPAITLYERHGFTRTGQFQPEPGLTVVTFRLERG
ncbi:GNAT family N-acetyltransferase [Actinokineospora fastidiosa]|uniref:N-acetyltransferase n=1 Tax=Actinokineospora fastidiosa TaxID=1816 RepID=A0A918LBB4_9PSEU|nr:GNAT family N-acetyltransferase [Actinokineospora fastidiosa]GGS27708.1 N-acetyltransferase [Actinokineospora fastidiosa]